MGMDPKVFKSDFVFLELQGNPAFKKAITKPDCPRKGGVPVQVIDPLPAP